MYFWAICFLIVGIIFIIAPHAVLLLINQCGSLLHFTERIPLNVEYFWLALAGSMMMVISYLSYKGGQDPSNHVAIRAVLICKLASSLFFLIGAVRTHNELYLIGTAVDFMIFTVIFFFYNGIKV